MSEALLEARDLTFERAGGAVFEPVDLALRPGEGCVVLGRNGAGKTTLLRVLAGILRPASGTVRRAAPVAFLGHLPAVKGDLTCRENLAHEAALGPAGRPVAEALALVGMAGLGRRPARELSAGQRRRLGLARLLVRRTPLWLLDEPYSSLDDEGCETVDAMLAAHREDGGTVVLATHQRRPPAGDGFAVLQLVAGAVR